MKIALVHDWLTRLGGAERVLIALHKIFPEAPIYTLFYDEKFVSNYIPKAKIIPSFLQKIPNIKKIHPWFKILMPLAVESLDLSWPDETDLVISSSHEFGHGVLTKQRTKFISYYHSPSRLLWDRAHEYTKDFKERGRNAFKILLIRLGQHFLRLWDYLASKRSDVMLANSKHVAERIKKYYGRETKVVYPPVELPSGSNLVRSFPAAPAAAFEVIGRFASLRLDQADWPANYFLIVSQLYPHKNIDLAVETFKLLNHLNLLIIGDGPEKGRLEKLIGDSPNIKLLGFVPDQNLPFFYENSLAYLICNEEDFGISPIEAMSFGKPVLAFKQGGAEETVLEGKTGEFFDKLESDCLSDALELISEKIKNGRFKASVIKKHAEKFGFERFKKEMLDLVKNLGYNYSNEI